MSSTGTASSWGYSDSMESDDETNSESASSTSSEDSDLRELYESFEYEEGGVPTLSRAVDTLVLPSAPLYPGADLSTFQSHLLVFQFAIRHSLTGKSLTELLQLLTVHLPQGAAIPKSVHQLKRFFVDNFPEAQAVQHVYCSCCQRSLASMEARCLGNGCSGGTPSVFITVPVGPQLKRMMEGRVKFNLHVHV